MSTSGTTIIIDDRDPTIIYSAGWTPTGTKADFNNTHHQAINGGSMSYSFRGVSISVWAAQYPGDLSNATFTIDGIDQRSWISPNITANNWKIPIFTSSKLSDGPHQLQVTTTRASGNATDLQLFLDYLLVDPGSDLIFTRDHGTLLYDDTHPDIQYTGPAQAINAPNVPLYDYILNSSHLMQQGSTFTFSFDGIYVTAFGTISNSSAGGSLATYQVDDATPTLVGIPSISVNDGADPGTKLFTSGALQPGPHTITVTSQCNDTFYFDYLLVSTLQWAPFDNSTASASPHNGGSSSSAGAIAGGVVGGLLFLAALITLVLCLRRRRKKYFPSPLDAEHPTASVGISPFPASPSASGLSSGKPPSRSYNHKGDLESSVQIGPSPTPSTSPPSAETRTSLQGTNPNHAIIERVLHTDSGVRLTDAGLGREVPPVYSPD